MEIRDWKRVLLLAAIGAPFTAQLALAQTVPAAPRASIGGNPLDALPQVNTPPKPAVSVNVQPPAPALDALLAQHLTPRKFEIEGVKALPFDDVAQRFAPLVGTDVTIGKLIETANGITALYKERGYALSFAFIPAQTFREGVVRITVVEGYIAQVVVKGNAGAAEKRIRAVADRMRQDRPLTQANFERYINVLGMIPGVKTRATVAPPQNTDGAATLELDVERKPFNVSTGIDFNHPGVQGILSATENGMLGFGESLSASALLPKGRDDQTYYALNGSLPIGTDGFTAKVDASHYHGHPVDNPGLPSYIERTVVNDKLAFSAVYPFLLSNARSLVGTGSVYASHDEDRLKNTIVAGNPQLSQRSQIRVAQLQLDYTGIATGVVRRASVNVAKAFDVLGASKSADTNIAGYAPVNPVSLTFVRTGASYTQSNEWPMKIGTALSLTGQYSPDSLPTSEQVSFGAQRFALGYQPGEVSGDSGFGASFEMNRPLDIGMTYLKTFTPYVMVDAARVFLQGGTASPRRLSSFGIGFRVSDSKHYSIDLSVAKATGDAPVESASRSPRVNASLSYQLD
ncbi:MULTISPECIES: POTRA domain-containing protein [unclassified Caballeronia]|uniref:ShlB/FhaC/HecB family hemolysin secretion/activation protein n=1 Tax=unclassified Caballeronia TaxID=2646786 RepID=UPI002864E60E|nr:MULTISPECIES: POTRA domain-containing protein [unclassified Caballeronia]MDR5774070.1 POTRA domain-containing protein [Caballeronia sp. LZ002]MDR5849505.1 POTRA domain-containing protein [Caballeronia sp. LZ003]